MMSCSVGQSEVGGGGGGAVVWLGNAICALYDNIIMLAHVSQMPCHVLCLAETAEVLSWVSPQAV